MDFHEIFYLKIFQKSDKKSHVALQADKNNGYFTWRHVYITRGFLEWEMIQQNL